LDANTKVILSNELEAKKLDIGSPPNKPNQAKTSWVDTTNFTHRQHKNHEGKEDNLPTFGLLPMNPSKWKIQGMQ
jgi:hypothetical protein